MFGIGSTELLVILLVALIVLGPKSLAGVSRSLGRAMGEFRKVSTDFQRTLNAEAAREDLREKEQKRAAESGPQTNMAKPDATVAESGAQTKKNPANETSPLNLAIARAQAEASQAADKANRQNG